MTSTSHHLPVILLLGEKATSHDEVDAWLAESRFSTREATSVFQILEDISDFTVDDTPDVVFLHIDRLNPELEMLERMLGSSAGDLSTCVIAFSDDEKEGRARDEISGLNALSRRLERLIPSSSHAN